MNESKSTGMWPGWDEEEDYESLTPAIKAFLASTAWYWRFADGYGGGLWDLVNEVAEAMGLPTYASDHRKWLSVQCPKCGAQAGERCVTSGGNPTENHSARDRAVRGMS